MKTKKQPKVVTEIVKVSVPVDRNQGQGLRGLRGMIFGVFQQATNGGKDLSKLPTCEETTAMVSEKYPQSRWIANPKIHHSYYKSKFISSLTK